MPSVSGLDAQQRGRCKDRVVQAALLALAHPTAVHYTMDGRRWEGIARNRQSRLGQFPAHSDCSSFATWCLWNGLFVKYGIGDVVNGHDWKAGFTGTMRTHGMRVGDQHNAQRGDCVFYDNPSHVTIVVAREADGLKVVSHGNERGPFKVKFDYRRVVQIRRYI
jgi:hypothetical protein